MTDATKLAISAVDEIITDLLDRRGLRQEWETIDSGVQQEIKEAWAQIIVEALQAAQKGEST